MQKMYSYIKVDEKIPIYKLSIADMIRSVFLKINETDRHALKNESAVTEYQNTLRSNLVSFFKIATEPIRKGVNKDVLLRVSSIYDTMYDTNKNESVLNSVINDPVFNKFYDFAIAKPPITFTGVRFKYKVYIKLKED